MSEDVVVTLVNHDSEDLVDFPEVHQVKLDGDEEAESASEGDIEIEHYVGDDSQARGPRGEGEIEIEQYVRNDSQTQGQGGENGSGEDPNQASNITFDVRKRTLIMLWQRTILEEYYRAGMTSASMQLHSLHQEASEKTGLDNSVVKNWIRNRRRPAAIKSAERMVEKISQGELVAPYVPPTSLTSLGTSLHPSPSNPIIALSQSRSSSGRSGLPGQQLGPSDPKKICTDQSPGTPQWPLATPSSAGLTPTQHSLHPTPSLQPVISPTLHTTNTLLLVKIRVNGSGETDFYEVEVPSPTYESLLKACAEEIEVETSQIAKIRKLPNILVRRDKDVQRLKEGQELEVVLKEEGGQHSVSAFCTSSGGLSMLNLSPLVTDTPSLGRSTVGLHPTSQHLNGLQ